MYLQQDVEQDKMTYLQPRPRGISHNLARLLARWPRKWRGNLSGEIFFAWLNIRVPVPALSTRRGKGREERRRRRKGGKENDHKYRGKRYKYSPRITEFAVAELLEMGPALASTRECLGRMF